MDEKLFNKNMEFLQREYIEIYNKLVNFNPSERKVFVEDSANGEKIICVRTDKHIYCLNDRYNEQEFVNEWLKDYEIIKYREVFLFFGLSNFSCIKSVVDRIGDNHIILLYEPDIEIFYNAIHIVDLTEILEEDNCVLCIKDVNENYFKEFIVSVFDYSNLRLLNYRCMPNYFELYKQEWKSVISDIKNQYSSVVMTRNTYMFFSKEFIKNDIENSRDMINQYVVNQLKEYLAEDELLEDKVAIIVSAGPSLDKNIKDLKLAKGKAFILAVDTALKSLLNNNIIPDLVITVDSHKPPILFAHKDFFNLPLVVCGISNHKLRHIHTGKRFYFDGGTDYIPYMYNKIKNKLLLGLESGGSVANNAFSLINSLGFKKIILVGQDLAYTDNKGHSLDAYKGTENDINKDDQKYFEVEDVYGNKVLTEGNMNLYRIWYENYIKRYSDLKVIDATEGGAKICGTEIMSLKEAINRECIFNVDFNIDDRINKLFSESEVRQLENEIENIEETIEEIKKRIRDGIRKYEKILELFRKNKILSKEFKKVMSDIDEIVDGIEKEPIMSLAILYNKSEEYDVLSVVNEIKDNLKDEINDVVNNGIKMLNIYQNAIIELERDIKSRKKFDKKEYENLSYLITKKIFEIENAHKKQEFLEIEKIMKEFMVVALDAIDIQYRVGMQQYDIAVEKLKEIIVEYTEEKYNNMVRIMKTEFVEVISNISID